MKEKAWLVESFTNIYIYIYIYIYECNQCIDKVWRISESDKLY